jgi:hypothetical protein
MGVTTDYLKGLHYESKNSYIEINGTCHDCKSQVKLISTIFDDDSLTITGGSLYKIANIEKPFFKCQTCFDKDSFLTHFQPCEVYSRVVGYLSPTKRWNSGKKEEFKERKNFKM